MIFFVHFKSFYIQVYESNKVAYWLGFNSIHKFLKINLNFGYGFFIQRVFIFVYLHSFCSQHFIICITFPCIRTAKPLYAYYERNDSVEWWMAVLKTHRQNKKINMPSLKWCVCRKLKKKETHKSVSVLFYHKYYVISCVNFPFSN